MVCDASIPTIEYPRAFRPKLKELISMEAPVAVEVGLACPRDELVRVLFPRRHGGQRPPVAVVASAYHQVFSWRLNAAETMEPAGLEPATF
jgi:hypothetical protein